MKYPEGEVGCYVLHLYCAEAKCRSTYEGGGGAPQTRAAAWKDARKYGWHVRRGSVLCGVAHPKAKP